MKKFVFVLMPFDKDFDDAYQLAIKPACINAGANCERLDEQIFSENMLDRIYSQISTADIIIADMIGRNPNVFYETGYAHAKNKLVILLTKQSEDIPFDRKHYPHIIYAGSLRRIKEDLKARVEHCVNVATVVDFQYMVNGRTFIDGKEVIVRLQDYPDFMEHFTINISIYNPTQNVSQ